MNLTCKPKFNPERIRLSREAGKYEDIKIKDYEFINKLSMNNQSQYILEISNGENTLDNIIESIYKQYDNVKKSEIQEDVMNFLFRMWRLETIEWEKNCTPFDDLYFYNIGDLKQEILTGKRTVALLEEYADRLIYDPTIDKKFQIRYQVIKGEVLTAQVVYSAIYKDEELLAIYRLKYELDDTNSIMFHPIYLKDSIPIDTNYFLESLNNTIKMLEKILVNSRKFGNIRVFVPDKKEEKNKYQLECLKNLGFKYEGTLRESHFFDNTMISLESYKLKI